ncbi:hypothetical protein ACIBG7_12850 [Nonomuraea sp. NPDC050328]|uniref:hypothetical protein n=1 Tax=Nonomuraea sp. NPDC050328 TaxID=3364361 RepID=UPI0037A48C03
MLDHPGWDHCQTGPVRAVRAGGGIWQVNTQPLFSATLIKTSALDPRVDVYDPAKLDPTLTPPGLLAALRQAGPVARLRNPDLWDALATAIIRQVIRAGHARLMHQRFRAAVGHPVEDTHLMPDAATVAGLKAEVFNDLGMAFKARPLRTAAERYLADGPGWELLAPAETLKAVMTVSRIGPWTASAAIADYTGDFSFYPYDDLAVRTWAARADPGTPWPITSADFADRWREAAGPHLSTLTALTLAWGERHIAIPLPRSGG